MKNKDEVTCVFYMKSGNILNKKMPLNTFKDLLILVKADKGGVLELCNEMQESAILIKITEIEVLKYWE